MALALLVITSLLLAIASCLISRSRATAWLVAVLSAAWLPVNNGHLEGPILLTLGAEHGLTLMDLVSAGGFTVAAWALRRCADRIDTGVGGCADTVVASRLRWQRSDVIGLTCLVLAAPAYAYLIAPR